MIEDDVDGRRDEAVQAAAYEGPTQAQMTPLQPLAPLASTLPLAAAQPISPRAPAVAGAAAALAATFEQHHAAVLRAAYRITGNTMDAEDVLQTVFTRLLRRADDLDLSQSGGSYLHRAAVNAALDLLRSRRRSRAVALADVEQDLIDENQPGPEHSSRNRELSRRLRAALCHLSPRQAEIFALRYFEGLGNLEIAKLHGSSQTAIAVILHRARHRLQKELGSPEGDRS
jgi:RNA polymerase sigma-70 factor (ECF subfamily)